jgi:amino acid adenylation domain-containing protein/non-ribosomal peptide synthase protein (TIGR01720 family)
MMNVTELTHQQQLAANQNVKEKEYWLETLAGDLETPRFPADRRDSGSTGDGTQTIELPLSAPLAQRLQQVSGGQDSRLFTILCAGVSCLLYKYTGAKDIVVGSAIFKQEQEGEFINTILPVRCAITEETRFKQLLGAVGQAVFSAIQHQNFPLQALAGFPFFSTAVLLDSIHDPGYINHIQRDVTFLFSRDGDGLTLTLEYDQRRFEAVSMENMAQRFFALMTHGFEDGNRTVAEVDCFLPEEKERLLGQFNDTGDGTPPQTTIHELFSRRAALAPERIAVSAPISMERVFDILAGDGAIDAAAQEELSDACFTTNPFVYRRSMELAPRREYVILKTHRHNSVVVNSAVASLLDALQSPRSLASIIETFTGKQPTFVFYTMKQADLLEITHRFEEKPQVLAPATAADWFRLFRLLHQLHMIDLTGKRDPAEDSSIGKERQAEILKATDESGVPIDLAHLSHRSRELKQTSVLLLGDTPGMPSTGLLYLASYLKRNGVDACCQFYDPATGYQSMKRNLQMVLEAVKPRLVAVSMKWFLYIARVLDICRIIKECSPDTQVVVGGNTASYYWEELIQEEAIDIIIRGDGEEPLLAIAKGEQDVPNTVVKGDDGVVENPFSYVQDNDSLKQVYLSHLDEILLSDVAPQFGTFYINTHKGCAMNCLYCGGCRKAQQQTYNRTGILRRGEEEVRSDLEAVRGLCGTLQFDFEVPDDGLLDYCRDIWGGIDLSNHFCVFATLTLPSPQLIELASRTFRYVYCDIDACTLSERHRMELSQKGLVKPQPTDEGIFSVLEECGRHPNVEVRINLITGLPLFRPEDIEPSERFLAEIMDNYPAFSELHWARLHAQPGAPVLENVEDYDMHSFASTYEDFLKYSQKNFHHQADYAAMEFFDYPFIYYNEQTLNSQITRFYSETTIKLVQHREERRRDLEVGVQLTYKELDEYSGRLALHLRELGVGRGSIVALMMERSEAIPAAILGVLKAGGAYLPIDPDYPETRVEYMLQDSGAQAVISQKGLLERIPFEGPVLDAFEPRYRHGEFTPLQSVHRGEDIVYAIYTSGTTGKSKGVLLKHENLVNYVEWFKEMTGLTDLDNGVLTSSYAFDLGYTSLYPPLLSGGCAHIPPREIYLSPKKLLGYIHKQRITYLKMTPSLFGTLVDCRTFTEKTLDSLRLVLVGGEAIDVDALQRGHEAAPQLEIINHYGPTEATIGCVARYIDFERFDDYREHPTIGKPIKNGAVAILGPQGQLLPIGAPGELCIGGVPLARGYLNRPQLTEERFVESSFDGKLRRLYRTGDQARWLEDGNIEFLGRIDHQIKIRGYRVELGEIENRLLRHAAVSEVVVVDRQNDQGDKYLCAYVVKPAQAVEEQSMDEGSLDLTDLGAVLKRQLADAPDTVAVQSNGVSHTLSDLDAMGKSIAAEVADVYDDRLSLTENEKTRYKRQMLLNGWGLASQERLKDTTVFIAGAGGGASPTMMQLALAGVGTIRVCDFDEVELSNLNRQFLHDESRIGMKKALSAQETIRRVNPNVKVIPITEKLTRENVARLVGDADMIFDMFDDMGAKFILSECAVAKNIPHVIAAMTDINGYCAVFHPPKTPCFHCVFDRVKLETLIEGMRQLSDDYSKNPLAVVSSSLFTSSGFIVTSALKMLLDLENPPYNRFFLFNLTGSTTIASSDSYRSMTYAFSDQFRDTCLRQGFDWEQGWRGRFLEELDMEPDPNCPLCGPKKSQKYFPVELEESTGSDTNETPSLESRMSRQPVAAVLLPPGAPLASVVMGLDRMDAMLVTLDPQAPADESAKRFTQSGARVLISDTDNLQLAETIRNSVHRGLPIVNLDEIDNSLPQPHMPALDGARFSIWRPDNQYNQLFRSLLDGRTFVPVDPAATVDDSSLPGVLRDFLLKDLPDYMIPSFFVTLERMPLNANNKLDRKALPDPMEAGAGAEGSAPRNPLEEKMAHIWQEVLGRDNIGIHDNFFMMGGDSIKSIQISARMKKEGYQLEMRELFQYPTIADLCPMLKTAVHTVSQEPVEGPALLTPIQHEFFNYTSVDRHHYNMSLMIRSEERLDKDTIQRALKQLLEHHDGLRATFSIEGEEAKSEVRGIDFPLSLVEHDLRGNDGARERLEELASQLQAGIDLSAGPLFKTALFHLDDGDRLLSVVHHLVVDAVSWRVLLEDLQTLLQGAKQGSAVELPLKTDSFRDWAQKLTEYAASDVLKEEIPYWRAIEETEVSPLHLDHPQGEDKNLHNRSVSVRLDETRTGLLLVGAHEAFGTEVNDLLLASLALAVKRHFDNSRLLVALEGHGREDIIDGIDVDRTVGWFTTTYPALLEAVDDGDLSRLVVDTKERLHKIPNKGIGYGLLKHLAPEPLRSQLAFRHQPQISFNYLGQMDRDMEAQTFSIAAEAIGPNESPRRPRQFPLTVLGMVRERELRLSFTFSGEQFDAAGIDALAQTYLRSLEAVIAFCSGQEEREMTPSDMYYQDLSTDELDTLFDD